MNTKKSPPYFQSKDKESYPSSIGVASSNVPAYVDYSTEFYPKPTQDE